jgi:hypothetical protein
MDQIHKRFTSEQIKVLLSRGTARAYWIDQQSRKPWESVDRPQNQRLKNLAEIFMPFGLLRALLRASYLSCSGKQAFMLDIKPYLQLPGSYIFCQKKKLPLCSTPENL